MCSFTKKLQLPHTGAPPLDPAGDFVPQTPYRGSAPGHRWGTSVPQTYSLFYVPLNNSVRSTPLVLDLSV